MSECDRTISVLHAKPGTCMQAYISVPDDLAVSSPPGPLDGLPVVHTPCLLCGSFLAIRN